VIRDLNLRFVLVLVDASIGVAGGGKGTIAAPKFLENLVILPFNWRFSKQNGVICLKSNISPPPKFWAGYATGCQVTTRVSGVYQSLIVTFDWTKKRPLS